MVEKGSGGSIVHISSISAQIANGPQMLTVYCCSKAAIDMLTKCMALELGPHNVSKNIYLKQDINDYCSIKT